MSDDADNSAALGHVREALNEPPPSALELFCLEAVEALDTALKHRWADVFVEYRGRLQREFLKGRVLSTTHGVDIFENIVACLHGGEWKEKGEYGDNFRSLIREFSAKQTTV